MWLKPLCNACNFTALMSSVVDIRMATHLFQTTCWISVQIWQYFLGNIVNKLAWVHTTCTLHSINNSMESGNSSRHEEQCSESENNRVKGCMWCLTVTFNFDIQYHH